MTPQAPVLTQIVVTPPSPTVVDGETQQFIATGVYNNGTSQDLTASVTWSSSDAAIASISSGGLATAVTDGTVTIRATSGGVIGSTRMTVNPLALVSITVAPLQLTLQIGQTQQYGAVATLSDNSQMNVTAKVTWSSSDSTIATTDEFGFATAVAAGTAVITASSGVLAGTSVLTIPASVPGPEPIPPTPPAPGTPADFLRQAQQAMFQLLLGNKPSRVDTPQLGSVEFTQTTPAQLQRVIDYLQGLVQGGNTWPTDGSAGSMNSGYTRGRKPFSFYSWP